MHCTYNMYFLYSCMVSFYSYGTCCVIIVSWRLCLGDCVLATVSWRLCLGDCALATVSWRLCLGDLPWRLFLNSFVRVLVARAEQIGDLPWRLCLNNLHEYLWLVQNRLAIHRSWRLAVREPLSELL